MTHPGGGARAQVQASVFELVAGDKVSVADLEGEVLIEHTRPGPAVTYLGNGRPGGPHPSPTQTSPMS